MGVVERRASSDGRSVEYVLTGAGRELQRVIDVLGGWGARWAFGDPRPTELDPIVLLWWMRRRVRRRQLPPRRVVIEFDFRGAQTGRYWLVLERTDASVCLQHPGFEVDLRISADIAAFYRVWLGRTTLAEATRAGLVRLDGMPPVTRAFPRWFAWSPMANAVRDAAVRRSTPMAAVSE
jgi:hypothetical protein